MRYQEIDEHLDSPDLVRVCQALRFLGGSRSGPYYPQAKVLRLLGPDHPDRVRENALKLVLKKGQHPLEDRRILDLFVTASRPLFKALVQLVAHHAFPSAAEDTFSWCWEKRLHTESRLAVLLQVEALGAGYFRRFLGRHRVLSLTTEVLVTAALSGLGRCDKLESRGVFERALTHPNPRFRSTALEILASQWSDSTLRTKLPLFQKDTHHRVRSTAAVLSCRTNPKAGLGTLFEMAHASAPLDRAAAAWGLGEVLDQDSRCRQILGVLENDVDLRVAKRARKSQLPRV